MRTDTAPSPIRLRDYTPPAYLVDAVHLTFRLNQTATRVVARLSMRPNPAAEPGQDLRFDGEKLGLIRATIDGQPVQVNPDDTGLTVPAALVPDAPFTWEAEVEIDPTGNTALEGLYMSKGMYCTQCEAEGFRKITYFPDRPDVMATYTVRIEGDAPVMLSNGNPTARGDGWAEWHDPWPKPSYLFALVAGNLVSHDDSFTTRSGRKVDLKIYVRPGDEGKCAYAMDALKRSMRWDEEAYGREYDLDLFMIVAVDDFNMGAMENKGLNIFNAKYVLASPDTATDQDYERIESIIAHEYFHNWTGNRITCRDWFQLCLKEGLTVYRDQQFSGDQRSHAVKRIDDVLMLRARQFREDAGPLAHPVRPVEYVEINNFYTATVYEKGAEVIGMLRRLVGPEAYRRALDLYFERHDGQACTIEDWIAVFEDATGRNLSQFSLWYAQSGTPRVRVQETWKDGVFTLTFSQTLPPTPGQPDKEPMVIPLATALLSPEGAEVVAEQVLELTQARQSFRFEGLSARPVPSINRGFSAPVILEQDMDDARRGFLLAHDTDPFNRWEAGREFARAVLVRMLKDPAHAPEETLLEGLHAVLADETLDPEFRALALRLPTAEEVFDAARRDGQTPDPAMIRQALLRLETALARRIPDLRARLDALAVPGPYSPDAASAGKRALRGRLLALLTRLEPDAATARELFASADNMTETMQALSLLVATGQGAQALARFHERWASEGLVLDKWYAVQASLTPPENAPELVAELAGRADFEWKNPNRFRSLIGAFAANMAGFHRADGAGYRLFADWLIRLDPVNPQTTARVAGAFETWRQFDAGRQALILTQLQRISDTKGLSKDTTEIVGRILEARA
ncbi:aminopeptidase N [Halovulum dunhuangense]|uniref:Aminopeptidase N n=1 Tax=Halovulum dunhuangense TaxID=1505036 RepID=A0A849L179_9RHOB|nr:aminopeptidase N [Halovulum dunhuangense]NNU80032.1 aminopeptidase N [Halovulum dunhuangense]